MDPKFDGPNLYSVIGSVAAEVIDLTKSKPPSSDMIELEKKMLITQKERERKMIEILTKMDHDNHNFLKSVGQDMDKKIKQVKGQVGSQHL